MNKHKSIMLIPFLPLVATGFIAHLVWISLYAGWFWGHKFYKDIYE